MPIDVRECCSTVAAIWAVVFGFAVITGNGHTYMHATIGHIRRLVRLCWRTVVRFVGRVLGASLRWAWDRITQW
jgi:hypothetical protein